MSAVFIISNDPKTQIVPLTFDPVTTVYEGITGKLEEIESMVGEVEDVVEITGVVEDD